MNRIHHELMQNQPQNNSNRMIDERNRMHVIDSVAISRNISIDDVGVSIASNSRYDSRSSVINYVGVSIGSNSSYDSRSSVINYVGVSIASNSRITSTLIIGSKKECSRRRPYKNRIHSPIAVKK